jgi:TonB family protein
MIPVENILWPSRRWFWTIFFVLVGHVGLVLWLSERAGSLGTPPSNAARLRFISDPILAERFVEMTPVGDPTLFAKINPRGYSGSAWLKMPVLEYELTNRIEAPRGLALNGENLAIDVSRFVQTNFTRVFASAERPPPLLALAFPRRPIKVIQPDLRIEGELAERRLISTNSLPQAEPNAILSSCKIEVIVNPAGHTVSFIKLASSGSANADKNALNFAKAARFEPLGPQGAPGSSSHHTQFTSGRLVFQWLSIEALTTNGAAAKP